MAWKNSVTLDEVIGLLNAAAALDRIAMTNLVGCRVPCNAELASHPTIQTGQVGDSLLDRVGIIGILNGLFGVDEEGWGPLIIDVGDGALRFGRTGPPGARSKGAVFPTDAQPSPRS